MSKLVPLNEHHPTDSITPVYINPTLVRMIRPAAGNYTRVFFAIDHSLIVVEPVETVREAIDAAMNGGLMPLEAPKSL